MWPQAEALFISEISEGEEFICPSPIPQVINAMKYVGWLGFPCSVTFILLNGDPAFTNL